VPGQLLGIAGCTGSCTGTHLHFEVRLDGTAVSPLRFLPAGPPVAPDGPAVAWRLEVAEAAQTLFAHVPGIRIAAWLTPHLGRAAQPRRVRRLAAARRPFP